MADPTTRHLEEILKSVDSAAKLEKYLEEPGNISPYDSFSGYFNSLPKVQALGAAGLYKASGIERFLCYKFMNGSKKPGREKIFRLCLAAGLSSAETRRALESAEQAPLYSRSQRDAVISYAIAQGFSVIEANDLLDELGLKPLD